MSLSHNALSAVPPVLAGATRLRTLVSGARRVRFRATVGRMALQGPTSCCLAVIGRRMLLCAWYFPTVLQDMRTNPALALSLQDVELLAALPHLQWLKLGPDGISRAPARVMQALRRRLPHLRLE